METVLELDDKQQGGFYIMDGNEQLGEMAIGINDHVLTVYHTEVSPAAEGKGLGKKLLETMVTYAREHQIKVVPLCPFVHAQFKRNPDKYKDLWP